MELEWEDVGSLGNGVAVRYYALEIVTFCGLRCIGINIISGWSNFWLTSFTICLSRSVFGRSLVRQFVLVAATVGVNLSDYLAE